jgi:hypothetical protein
VNVELYIEELVLHGFQPGGHHLIGAAAERELSRLFAERGVPPSLVQGGDATHLDAGAFKMTPDLGAKAAGEQIARSLYRGMTR